MQTLPPVDIDEMHTGTVGQVAGFNLHAGVDARANQRRKLERLCRYIARPAVSEQRLSLTAQGKVRYQLKTPYRDGTTHVIFEPLDFISRLAALVPKPRVNLTRYHGVFAPNSQHRARVTPARRGRGHKAKAAGPEEATPVERHAAMSWAQRLKRVFDIDIETCRVCGGSMKVIACIEDPLVIKKILTHLRGKGLYVDDVSVCRRAGRHRRATCSAEIRKPVLQHTKSCEPDRRGRMPFGQLAGICLEKVESAIGERGFY